MRRAAGVILPALLCFAHSAEAHQLAVTFGYANSGTPRHGTGVSDYIFASGGGIAFGTRVDLEREHLWFGPAFTFWNNLTGDPQIDWNSSYLQAELGGRISLRTRTVPSLYGGIGAGYTFSHGENVHRFSNAKESYDGEFPTGSVHFGAKTPSRANGLGLIGETSYHFGLDRARGRNAVGPARAFLIQIGLAFEIQLSPRQ